MRESHGVCIREAYKNYTPPLRAAEAVDRLLNGIPKKHLAGLRTIVITDSACLPRDERKKKIKARGRKFARVDCLGFYSKKWRGEPAWIRLVLDNILASWPNWTLRIPLLRDVAIAEVLFHEIGHHIHRTKEPEHREPEDVADAWREKLIVQYLRKRCWYLAPLGLVPWLLRKPIYRIAKKHKIPIP